MISELEYDWKIQSKHMVFSIQPVGLAIHIGYPEYLFRINVFIHELKDPFTAHEHFFRK